MQKGKQTKPEAKMIIKFYAFLFKIFERHQLDINLLIYMLEIC